MKNFTLSVFIFFLSFSILSAQISIYSPVKARKLPLPNSSSKMIKYYQFEQASAPFNSIASTGTEVTPNGDWDDGYYYLDLTGQFSFVYNLKRVSSFSINTNGTLVMGRNQYIDFSNNLADNDRWPVLAPLWDDLNFYKNGSGDGLFYQIDTSGTDTVLTIEWNNVCRYGSNGNPVSFQIKLHSQTGVIEFIYSNMSKATNWSASASIGINDQEDGVTKFISVTPGTPPTVSYTTANNSINGTTLASIDSGTVYRFTYVPPDYDLGIIKVTPNLKFVGDTINLSVDVFNNGTTTANNFTLITEIFDADTNQIFTDTLTVSGAFLLYMNDSTFVMPDPWIPDSAGVYTIRTYLTYANDQDSTNDTLVSQLIVLNQPQYALDTIYGYDLNKDSTAQIDIDSGHVKYLNQPDIDNDLVGGDFVGLYPQTKLYATSWWYSTLYYIHDDGIAYSLGKFSGLQEGDKILGFTWDQKSNTIYAIAFNFDNGTNLYTLDIENMRATFLANIADHALNGLAADTSGQLYVIDLLSNSLCKIDKNTYTLELVNTLGINLNWAFIDLAIDRTTNILYGTLYDAYHSSGAFGIIDTTPNITNSFRQISYTSQITMAAVYSRTYTVAFNIIDTAGNALEGTTIKVGGQILTTNTAGSASTELGKNQYTAIISKYGYYTDTLNFTVNSDSSFTITLRLMPKVTFTIIDNDNNPLDSAKISVNGQSIYTNTNGIAEIPLPAGQHTANISKDGYFPVNFNFDLSSDTSFTISLTPVPVTYTVTFNVTDSASNPLSGASIYVAGYTLTTDNTGTASITLNNGDYTAVVTKDYYDYKILNFTLSSDTTFNVKLTRISTSLDNIDGIKIYPNPASSVVHISNAQGYILTIYNLAGKTIVKQAINRSLQTINVGKLPAGLYLLNLRNSKKQINLKLMVK